MIAASAGAAAPRPRHWEKYVLVAYLRMLGMTQRDAGRAVGRAKRTVATWEAQTALWQAARTEAEQRWLTAVVDASRQTLLKAIQDGAVDLALKVLERTVAALAPATQRLKVQHEVGDGLSGLVQAFEDDHADVLN